LVELGPLDVLDTAEGAALHQAAGHLARFLGVPVTVTGPPPT
jgi:trimethylamine:corrinoid methyltransferase-like protein